MGRSFGNHRHNCGKGPTRLRRPPTLLRVDLDGLAAFLREAHPHDTAVNVAADIAVSVRTVERWLASDRAVAPRLDHFFSLIAAYGPNVLAAAYPAALGWLEDAKRRQESVELHQRIAEAKARLAELGED